ncbi:hypothetical protein FHX08_001065 [Rhizobium sp. BK529]|uniref:KTSC domain-containing protein n=1 Tax=unclassified Rhizobium TaxID=2613769 RepID=UPI0010433846|nr:MULTISPECIES: KTSC domain-containing protein [unclassified Rhizobium]MBB3590721.1 hypothetical protein [Rhizobium sp. BK529]TCS05411.1 KTSC domain-containing protein [Rhizobium sp. BK418]
MEISSRLIKEIIYNPRTRILDVELRLKGRRRYFNVPPGIVKNLVTAPSPGWYYTQHIHSVFPRTDVVPRSRFAFPWLRPRGDLEAQQPSLHHAPPHQHHGAGLPAWLQKWLSP